MAADRKYLHSDISDKILKAFFTVRHGLPYGLDLEIYRRAIFIEMTSCGMSIEKNKEVAILYKDHLVGSVSLDFVADDKIIIKLIKKEDAISQQDKEDMLNQLRLTKYEVGLILNFSADEEHKRIILTADLKTGSPKY